jgi:hypothetical protein
VCPNRKGPSEENIKKNSILSWPVFLKQILSGFSRNSLRTHICRMNTAYYWSYRYLLGEHECGRRRPEYLSILAPCFLSVDLANLFCSPKCCETIPLYSPVCIHWPHFSAQYSPHTILNSIWNKHMKRGLEMSMLVRDLLYISILSDIVNVSLHPWYGKYIIVRGERRKNMVLGQYKDPWFLYIMSLNYQRYTLIHMRASCARWMRVQNICFTEITRYMKHT